MVAFFLCDTHTRGGIEFLGETEKKCLACERTFHRERIRKLEDAMMKILSLAIQPSLSDAIFRLDMIRNIVKDTDLGPDPQSPPSCDHGVTFNEKETKNLSVQQIRKRWPRLMGACPKGCGFNGIGYASYAHYICGDW